MRIPTIINIIKTLETRLKEDYNINCESDYPIYSDKEYNALKTLLEQLDPDNEVLKLIKNPNIADAKKIKHEYKMLSLAKIMHKDTFNKVFEELNNWAIKEEELIVEPKFKGINLLLYYAGGNLEQIIAIGEGSVGVDVTFNIKVVKSNIPEKLKYPFTGYIIGGIYTSKKNLPVGYTSARKYTYSSLLLKTDNLEELRSRTHRFIAYDIPDSEFSTENDKIKWLNALGFDVPGYQIVNAENAVHYFAKLSRDRNNLDYDIDGVIVKYNKTELQTKLGYTNGFPNWAITLKFKNNIEITVLKDIIWNYSSVVITPNIIIEPISSDIQPTFNIHLRNAKMLADAGLEIGDILTLERDNKETPQLISNISKNIKVVKG